MTKATPEAKSVKIKCAFDEMVAVHKVVPHPRNPNRHPPEQIRLLMKIIDFTGFRVALAVSTLSGYLIKGHARLEAAVGLGMLEVPVDYQDYDNEAQEWADLLADNRIAELAEMDRPVLKDLLQDMDTGAMDMEHTGFDLKAIEDLMTAYPPLDMADAGDPWGLRGNITGKGKAVVGVGRFLAAVDHDLVTETVEAIKARWGEEPEAALTEMCRSIVGEGTPSQ